MDALTSTITYQPSDQIVLKCSLLAALVNLKEGMVVAVVIPI